MDPVLLEMLQGLLSSNLGSGLGLSPELTGQLQGSLGEYLNKEQTSQKDRLNITMRDLEPFRVNPFRGYMARKGGAVSYDNAIAHLPFSFLPPSMGLVSDSKFPMGGFAGGLPSIPASVQMDTINNTPSNLPGGAGGKYDLSQLALQPNLSYSIPKSQPFSDPILGNKLLEVDNRYQPAAFRKGGWTHSFGGRAGSLIERARDLRNYAENEATSADDIRNYAQSRGFRQGRGPLGTILGGLGLLGGVLGGPVGALLGGMSGIIGNQSNTYGGGTAGSFGNLGFLSGGYQQPQNPSYFTPTGNLFDQINQNRQPMVPNLSNMFGIPMGAQTSPGQLPTGKMGGNVMHSGFGFLPSRFRFQEGGPAIEAAMNLVPIQTEKVGKQPEMIIHLDGTITPVNATTTHERMDDDEVTDIVPEGSYIASADKSMRISYKDADNIVIGIKHMPYKERKQGKVPEEITLASLWPGNSKRDMSYAELAERLSKTHKVVDKSEWVEHGNDIFTQATNRANLNARIPYLTEIIRLNEESRTDGGGTYRKGGVAKYPLGGILPFIGSALPFVSSLFGGGQQGSVGQVSPLVQSGILGTVPMAQLGYNQNIGAQMGQLGTNIDSYNSLANQLIADANQSAQIQSQASLANTGLGLLGQFSQDFTPQLADFSAERSRLQNYQPRSASRNAVDALSTPNFDANAIMSQLGARSGPVIAQLYSDQIRNRNQLLNQRNQFLDQFEQNRIGQLNQLGIQEQSMNLPELRRVQALENQRNLGITGTLGSGIQRGADLETGRLSQIGNIQSQILPVTAQLAQQRAGLAGMNNILGAQNALNAYSMLGSMQSQNALAQQQQGGSNPLGTIGSMFGNFLSNSPFGPGSSPGQLPTPSIMDLQRTQPSLGILTNLTSGSNGLGFATPNDMLIMQGLQGLNLGG